MSLFHKMIYKIGENLRNPLIQSALYELKESDFASLETLHEIQLERLKQLLHHAKKHSPFYKDRLNGINIDSMTLDDLQYLPMLSKQDLYQNVEAIGNNPYRKKLIKSETSGSTGNALIFNRTPKWDAYHRAAQYRGYSWYDVQPWEKNIYFWGFNPNWKRLIKVRFLDFLLNRYRIFSFNDKILKKASKFLRKVRYVEGYSSAVFTLTRYLEQNNLNYDNIKLVKGTSEKIYDSYNHAVKNVFGRKMTSEYGAAETGIIAFECPHGNMHIAMENVIVEIVEDKIIVTNLHSDSFPIIRYELGDYVVMDSKNECTCGRKHLIIREVTGRIGKNIVGKTASYPTLTLYYVFKNIALEYGIELAYFGVQREKGKLEFEIIRPEYDEKRVENYILVESVKYFGDDMDVTIRFIDAIEQKNKKTKDFESYLE